MESSSHNKITFNKKVFYALIPNAGVIVSLLAMGKSAQSILYLIGMIGGIAVGYYLIKD